MASAADLKAALQVGVQVVGVDEAQFFDEGLVGSRSTSPIAGVPVIVAGLDQDFSRQPFGPMPKLLALAEMVDKMHAVCVRCGGPAHYSQKDRRRLRPGAGGRHRRLRSPLPRLLRALPRLKRAGSRSSSGSEPRPTEWL